MRLSFLFTVLFFYNYVISAQSIKVKESEFTGVVQLVNKDNSTSQKLEKQTMSAASKADIGAAILGIMKGKSMNVVYGSSSPIRVSDSTLIKLIVKVKDNSQDPMEVVNIFKLEQDKAKDKRVLIVGKQVFNQASTLDVKFIQFEGKKYGTSSYLIEIKNLAKGEYALTLDGTRTIFNLFGVD